MATGKLIGTDSIGGTPAGSANYVCACRWAATGTGKVQAIKIYANTNGNVKAGLYTGNLYPETRVGVQNTSTPITANQWNTITLESEVEVSKDTNYWILSLDAASIQLRSAAESGRLSKYRSRPFADGLPATFDSSWTDYSNYYFSLSAYGVLVISPPGLSQPIAYGTPKLSLSIKPPGHQQVIAYGTPTISTAGLVIVPQGIAVVISYGTPSLIYPQTISPPGLSVPLAYGTPTILVAGAGVIFVPGHQQVIGYGVPTVLKYVWHVILDGQYNIESPETNRSFVIGRDVNGNPVWGEAQDSTELDLVGERLDFQPDPAIPTQAQAADVAAAMLSKMRLGKKRGVIFIPYNCGQELWDVVQITDAGANQAAVSFRVVGIRFEYHPKQARYEHKLILGAS